MRIEYKTVGAPERSKRKKGAKTRSDRVAAAMEEILLQEAQDGWTYLRTDLIPVEERSGWLGRAREVHRAVMVFQRVREDVLPAQPSYRAPAERHLTTPVAHSETRMPEAPPLPESAPAARFEHDAPTMPTTRAEPTLSTPQSDPTPMQEAAAAQGGDVQPAMKITRAMGMHPGNRKGGRGAED